MGPLAGLPTGPPLLGLAMVQEPDGRTLRQSLHLPTTGHHCTPQQLGTRRGEQGQQLKETKVT